MPTCCASPAARVPTPLPRGPAPGGGAWRRHAALGLTALLTAFGVPAWSAAATGPVAPPRLAAIDPATVPPREKAPNDESAYRRLVLPNGMKVILLSDPKLNVASASMAVGVGSLSDPPSRPGLAHYLEHMLFLGTEKYPGPEEYSEYLQRNGGYSNAYTARDRTNYHLEVRPEAFEGAVDRFAQFFIAPLFTPEFNEREVNAVNSEYQKNLENDGWREFSLRNTVLKEGHPARQFFIGSLETLRGTTQKELRDFHHRYYSANRMTLALTGPVPLDTLEQWARGYFAAVPNLNRPELHYDPEILPRMAALRVLYMEPLTDIRRVTLTFPLPDLRADLGSKPAEQLGYVLGHEGAGSLLATLKADGLATGLSAGADRETHEYGSFDIAVSLTPEGLKRWNEVAARVFAVIERLRRDGMPPYLFAERQAMAALDERWQDKGEGANRAVALANGLMDYPIEWVERVPYLWIQPDPAAIQRVLARLTPDNLLVTLVAKGQKTDQVEPFFGTHYRYEVQRGAAYDALKNPPALAGWHAPAPNPYIPGQTAMHPLSPARLIDEPALSLYYAQDTEFQRPQVAHIARFVLPRELGSLRAATLLAYYGACVRESLVETTYAASEAGLNFELSAGLTGVQFAVSGYDASAGKLLEQVAPHLRECKLSPERFAALKDQLLRGLSAFERTDAYLTLLETRRRMVREFYYRPDELLAAARPVTLDDVQNFAHNLYDRGKLEMLSYGNVSAEQARQAARQLASTLGVQPAPEAGLLRPRLLAMSPGQPLRTQEKLAVNNSAYRRELMLGADTPELRAATMALAALIGPPTYAELRTQQQLGYIVFGGAGNEGDTQFAYFIVQSGDHPADVLASRTDAFIATLPGLPATLTPEAWQAIVAGVKAKLEEKDKSIAERGSRLFGLAYDRKADWSRDVDTIAALKHLTPARLTALLHEAIDPATARSRSYLGFARQHPVPATVPAGTIADLGDWKTSKTYR